MLDDAGYTLGDDGFRVGPDGERISFAIDVIPTLFPEVVDVVEQIVSYWQAVGIDAQTNVIERTLFYDRKDLNEQDANVWGRRRWFGRRTRTTLVFPLQQRI